MKNKKYILLTTALVALSLTGCGNKITQIADTMTVELGDDLNFNVVDYFKANEKILSELAVDSSDNKSDPITISIPVSTTVSIQFCTYDASTNTYHITEEIAGELSARYPDIMSKIIGNGDLENAFYDYIFGGNMEDEIDWGVMDIVVAPMQTVDPADFLESAGLYKKPSTATSEKKDNVSKSAQSQPTETQEPTQSQESWEDKSGEGMMGDEQAAAWAGTIKEEEAILNSGYDNTDYGDVGIH